MNASSIPRPWLALVACAALLAGCVSLPSLTGSEPATEAMRTTGVAATPAQTAVIRSAVAGDAQARAEIIKLGYKSPQQVMAGLNDLVQNRGGLVKAANYRAENKHNNGLDGGSLTLFNPDRDDPKKMRWWVDIRVYADANMNTVVEGVFKQANTPRGASGEGFDLMQDLRSRIGVSKFDDRLPPALLFKGDFASRF